MAGPAALCSTSSFLPIPLACLGLIRSVVEQPQRIVDVPAITLTQPCPRVEHAQRGSNRPQLTRRDIARVAIRHDHGGYPDTRLVPATVRRDGASTRSAIPANTQR